MNDINQLVVFLWRLKPDGAALRLQTHRGFRPVRSQQQQRLDRLYSGVLTDQISVSQLPDERQKVSMQIEGSRKRVWSTYLGKASLKSMWVECMLEVREGSSRGCRLAGRVRQWGHGVGRRAEAVGFGTDGCLEPVPHRETFYGSYCTFTRLKRGFTSTETTEKWHQMPPPPTFPLHPQSRHNDRKQVYRKKPELHCKLFDTWETWNLVFRLKFPSLKLF